mmetsp:Transcript_14952/g.42268  ORF Transcript_14952/g.42268 Transcript_14952/m.42268 type:complete len:217 (-) Transcript_14952:698-1348(-)
MARYTLAFVVLQRELVIITQFLPGLDILLGVHDDSVIPFDGNDFRVAIWIATGVDESRHIALLGRIANHQIVDAEHVIAANFGSLVLLFALFCHGIPDHDAPVLDDHLPFPYVRIRKDSPCMNSAAVKAQLLLSSRQCVEGNTQRRHVSIQTTLACPNGAAARLAFLRFLLLPFSVRAFDHSQIAYLLRASAPISRPAQDVFILADKAPFFDVVGK